MDYKTILNNICSSSYDKDTENVLHEIPTDTIVDKSETVEWNQYAVEEFNKFVQSSQTSSDEDPERKFRVDLARYAYDSSRLDILNSAKLARLITDLEISNRVEKLNIMSELLLIINS